MLFLDIDLESGGTLVQAIIASLLGITLYIKLMKNRNNNLFNKKKDEE